MSRFFSSLNSSSSSSSSGSDSEGDLIKTVLPSKGGFFSEEQNNCSFSSEDEFMSSSSNAEDDENSGNMASNTVITKKSKFAFDFSDESDDDSTERVSIKSAREKIRDELDSFIDLLLDELESFEEKDGEDEEENGESSSATKINFTFINDEFEKILKIISKPSNLSSLSMDEDSRSVFHGIFGLLFAKIESVTSATSQTQIKLMNATDAKSFNALRQRIRKALKTYEVEVKQALEGMDSDQIDDGNDSSSPVASSGNNIILSKISAKNEDIVLVEDMVINPPLIPLILKEIISLRGKKGVDRHLNISILQRMIKVINDLKMSSLPLRRYAVHASFAILSNSFDICNSVLLSSSSSSTSTSINPFTASINGSSLSPECISYLLGEGEALFKRIKEMDCLLGPSLLDACGDIADEALGLPNLSALRCTLLSYCNRIDDEWIKGVQGCGSSFSSSDCTSEYLSLLKMEKSLFAFLDSVKGSITGDDQVEFISSLTVRQLEHIYSKPSFVVEKYFTTSFMDMIQYLYRCGSTPKDPSSQQAKALLYHTYHLIIEGKGSSARLLLSESGLIDLIPVLDISIQILYNRCLVLLGLFSFGEGKLREAYHSLQDICGSGRTRELLGQAPFLGSNAKSKELSFTQEQERQEKRRLIAFHMQINVELIDTVFLTSSLLLEIPQMAAQSRRHFMGMDHLLNSTSDSTTKRISSFEKRPFNCRHLKRIIDGADRQAYGGGILAENCRDRIILAYNHMIKGEWKKCEQELLGLESFSILSGMLVIDLSSLKEMISFKVKESAIYYFIYSIGPNLKNLSLKWMIDHFEVDAELLKNIINELINCYGLPAMLTSDGLFKWKLDSKSSLSDKSIDSLIQIKEKVTLLAERRKEITEASISLRALLTKNDLLQQSLSSQE